MCSPVRGVSPLGDGQPRRRHPVAQLHGEVGARPELVPQLVDDLTGTAGPVDLDQRATVHAVEPVPEHPGRLAGVDPAMLQQVGDDPAAHAVVAREPRLAFCLVGPRDLGGDLVEPVGAPPDEAGERLGPGLCGQRDPRVEQEVHEA